jgi:glycosyltransferase involved in cell wall biosynthesis
MSVSIIMPAYNEEGCIENVVREYYDKIILKLPGSEFILVDDCSTDRTKVITSILSKELIDLKIIRNEVNKGHGKSLRIGFMAAKNEYIFYTDSDACFGPDNFWKLYNLKDKATLISGYRINREDPIIRKILSKAMKSLNLILFGVHIKDINCAFKLIKSHDLIEILRKLPENSIAPQLMISIVISKKRKLLEVPIQYYPRGTGKSTLNGFTFQI